MSVLLTCRLKASDYMSTRLPPVVTSRITDEGIFRMAVTEKGEKLGTEGRDRTAFSGMELPSD